MAVVRKGIGPGATRCIRSPAGAADTVRDLCWQCPDFGLGQVSVVLANAEHGGCREEGREVFGVGFRAPAG